MTLVTLQTINTSNLPPLRFLTDTVNIILCIGNMAHQIAMQMLDQDLETPTMPGMPRRVFCRHSHPASTGAPPTSSILKLLTQCDGPPTEAAAEILATSQELLYPTRPHIPEVEMLPEKADVVVIGAGVAGIHAAQQFTLAGESHSQHQVISSFLHCHCQSYFRLQRNSFGEKSRCGWRVAAGRQRIVACERIRTGIPITREEGANEPISYTHI